MMQNTLKYFNFQIKVVSCKSIQSKKLCLIADDKFSK